MAWKLISFLIWMPYSQSSKIDRTNEGLEVVPRNFDISVSILILAENILEILNSTSFDICFQLTEINLRSCQTTYIEDGTIDNQHKLVTLNLARCRIMQLPRSFGPSTASLKYFQLFKGYRSNSIFRHPYFASFRNLYHLDIGVGRNLEPFNVSILPSNIARCRLDFSGLLAFPYFSNQSKLSLLNRYGQFYFHNTTGAYIYFDSSSVVPSFSKYYRSHSSFLSHNITTFPKFKWQFYNVISSLAYQWITIAGISEGRK